jgi:hypothetical protein
LANNDSLAARAERARLEEEMSKRQLDLENEGHTIFQNVHLHNGFVFYCVDLRSSGLLDMPNVSNVPTAAVVMFVILKCVGGREGWSCGGGGTKWLNKGLFVAVKLSQEII